MTAVALSVTAGAQTTYERSKHGDPVNGVLRLPEVGPGACSQCHDEHASRDGVSNGGPFNRALFMIDDETLCYECHSVESGNRVYPGNVVWADSTHSTSSNAWWRGPVPPARASAEAGRCVNCHDPHGAEDGSGVIPSMLRLREESLCTGCHNGIAAKDVKTQVAKLYRHPIGLGSRHSASEGASSDPSLYDDSGTEPRRHAECGDCHNPHVARSNFVSLTPPEASERLHGVSRIGVTNGAAGTLPIYQWKGADDLIDPFEFEVCFKCHSSWTTLPPGKPDLALLTNPNNPSYHPIQGRGRNANIDALAFETGWAWDSLTWCSDCHGSDDPQVAGPHGSTNRFILRRPSPFTSTTQLMSPGDLCFSCHRYEVYGDPLASPPTQRASRFNSPGERGHAYHVGQQGVPCYACHTTHGSTSLPALIATGRTPGVLSYAQNAGGGTCAPTCHVSRSYSVNYAR
ncbi:MAG: cytochrome c3 family protein [Thermoanaerobaculia bacterium]